MADVRESTTIIGPEARFKGELTLTGAAKILGVFEGVIRAEGEVTVGNGALCQATVEADVVLVDGRVEGDLIARERLQLTGRANVQGDVTAAALVVAEGASFAGRVSVGPEAIASRSSEARGVESKPIASPRAVARVATDWARESGSGDWLQSATAGTPKPTWLPSDDKAAS
jgi:cytoskeletal protein CcmA (bactofilin family)